MKKIWFIIFLFLIPASISFAQKGLPYGIKVLHSFTSKTDIIFYEDYMEIIKYDKSWEEKNVATLNGHMFYDNGLMFFRFQDDPSKLFSGYNNIKIKKFSESPIDFLILHSKEYNFTTIIYQNDLMNEVLSSNYFTDMGSKKYSSSSYLSERDINYIAENLENFNSNSPWVEGKRTNGIGEYISMENNRKFNKVIISNGFVSYEKPYLYKANSRLKAIRFFNKNLSINFEYILEDTPNFQIIELPIYTDDITIEILSIYEGNQWPNDTCLNILSTIEVIPDAP